MAEDGAPMPTQQEQVRRIIAYMKTLPPWDGKTYDEKLAAMLRELQQPTSHGAGVSND